MKKYIIDTYNYWFNPKKEEKEQPLDIPDDLFDIPEDLSYLRDLRQAAIQSKVINKNNIDFLTKDITDPEEKAYYRNKYGK